MNDQARRSCPLGIVAFAALLTACSGQGGGTGVGSGGTGGSNPGTGGSTATGGSSAGTGGSGVMGTGGATTGTGGVIGGSGGRVSSDAGADRRPADATTVIDSGSCDGGTASSRHTAKALGTTAAKNGYWEYMPPGCGGTEKAPLMVFWHGIGENGSGSAADLARVANNGPPRLIRDNQWPGSRPFVVLSPQHSGSGCPTAAEIHDFLAYAISSYDVDPTRVYLTGLSCGAMGSASYLAQYAGEQVAAAVLIAGRSSPMWSSKGCALVDAIGLWAFHGDADSTVAISDDNTTMPRFIACPQPPRKDVQYTVYPGVGHDSWTRTYNLSAGHDIYTWFLGFKK